MGKENFWVAFIGFLIFVLITGFVIGPKIWRHFHNKHIERTGIQAPAHIVEVIDTGNRSNYNPEVLIKLEVQPAGGPPFLGEVRMVVSAVALQALRPGAIVTVKYDPERPSAVAIVP
jgi:hypothetical protein